MNHYIYEIVNRVNGMKYYGVTKNVNRRSMDHFKHLSNGKHTNSYLQHAYNKYGLSSFEFNVIGMAENEQYAAQDEMAHIWRAYPNCYNYLLGQPETIFTTHRSAPSNVLDKSYPRPSLKPKKIKKVNKEKAEFKKLVRKIKTKKVKPLDIEDQLNKIAKRAREELNVY